MKHTVCTLFLLISLALAPIAASTEPSSFRMGEDITAKCTVQPQNAAWFDESIYTYAAIPEKASLTITSEQKIGGIYLRFDKLPSSSYTLEANGKKVTQSPDFLHRYFSAEALFGSYPTEITLIFDEETVIADLFVLSPGAVPDFVQVWEAPCKEADLLLAPTHADDDHLFFLGILPYYAGELGYEVQVVYFTNHNAVHDRPHELLDGLWAVGVKNYPIIAEMRDAWDGTTKTLDYGYQLFKWQGYEKEDLIAFWAEMIRRFRPQVIVGHDIRGEYGHPQHMVNTDALLASLDVCGEKDYDPNGTELAPWIPEKVYLHLWEENKIQMDWDQPLSAFGGKSAYEVSCLGYFCHKSQQFTWFTSWLLGKDRQYTSAAQIASYSPSEYGLYFTRVGIDTVGGDFFENLSVRSQIPAISPDTDEAGEEPLSDSSASAEGNASDSRTGLTLIILPILLLAALFLWRVCVDKKAEK